MGSRVFYSPEISSVLGLFRRKLKQEKNEKKKTPSDSRPNLGKVTLQVNQKIILAFLSVNILTFFF